MFISTQRSDGDGGGGVVGGGGGGAGVVACADLRASEQSHQNILPLPLFIPAVTFCVLVCVTAPQSAFAPLKVQLL